LELKHFLGVFRHPYAIDQAFKRNYPLRFGDILSRKFTKSLPAAVSGHTGPQMPRKQLLLSSGLVVMCSRSFQQFDFPRAPGLVEPRVERAVEAEIANQPLPGAVAIQLAYLPAGAVGAEQKTK
jgi:hypothetical protein